jgi:catechol 2,3-dioxygenase
MREPMPPQPEPMFEVAHLAAVELLSPKREQSVAFFADLLGMYTVRRDEHATYLRGYEDPYAYSLMITDAPHAGIGVTTFRTYSLQALERRAKALEVAGLGDGWIDGDFGHGSAYLCHTPDGHRMKLAWNFNYAQVQDGDKTALLNRPSKRPARGVPVRRLDHINLLCSDVTANKDALMNHLGFRLSEHVVFDDGSELAAWLRTTQLAHDVAFMKDQTGARGRLHHVAFWYGIPQHLMDVAELCVQNDIVIEAGPGKHGISQALFLYVIEPGGNRIELFGDSGYLIFDPTWKPVRWQASQAAKGIIWIGSDLPKEFFIYGTPIIGGDAAQNASPQQAEQREGAVTEDVA